MNIWTTIAQAVADKYGVDVHATDNANWVNEARLNNRDIEAKEFKSGLDVVKVGGQGIGGNATAKFGDRVEGTNKVVAGDDNAEAAADEFAALMDMFKDLGLLDVVLADGANNRDEARSGEFGPVEAIWTDLALAMGASTASEQITPFWTESAAANNDNVEAGDPRGFTADRDYTTLKETDNLVDTDSEVNVDTRGLGGGSAKARFEEEADAEAFADDVQSTDPVELLGVQGGGDSGTWNEVADENGAFFSQDSFTFRSDRVVEEGEIPLRTREIEEFEWTVGVGGNSVPGNAIARFDSEEDARAFEEAVDSFLELGLQDVLF